MMVTDTHTATLQAMLTGKTDEYERGVAQLERTGDYEGWLALLRYSFHDAVVRRFSPTWTAPEIIRLVARLRSQWIDDMEIDPDTAEHLIRAELGAGTDTELTMESAGPLVVLVTGLIADEELDEDGIAAVLARARARANAQTG